MPEFTDVERLRELVREYGQRGASRLTGIPRTTIQYMLAHERASPKHAHLIKEGYGTLTETRLAQRGMPVQVAEPLRQASPERLRSIERTWDRVSRNIQEKAWREYQDRYEQLKQKRARGEKLSQVEKEILDRGLGRKTQRRVKDRALNNLQYTSKSWEELVEIYGRRRR